MNTNLKLIIFRYNISSNINSINMLNDKAIAAPNILNFSMNKMQNEIFVIAIKVTLKIFQYKWLH